VLGTRLGNITNQDGYYFVNNVPAGLQDVQAQYIGYQSVTVRQQRILSGQTTTLNFKLAQGAVAIEAIQVVGERAPLVPRDQVASKNIITGESIDQLPVDNTRRVITLQPGVVESNRSKGISIRGGRSGEEAVYVDGVLIRNYNGGQSSGDYNLQVGTNALAEADVVTGGFSAEYGEAQSGIINYVTKTGGRRLTGAGSFQTDGLFPKEMSQGSNRGEFSLGGPLFGPFSFFGAVTAQGNQYANTGKLYRDMPIYYANGIDTVVTYTLANSSDQQTVAIPNYTAYNGHGQVPLSNSDEYTADGKIDFSYGSGSRVFLSLNRSRSQGRYIFGNGNTGTFYDPISYQGNRSKNAVYTLGWTQNFVKSAEHALALDFKFAMTTDEYIQGVLNNGWEVNHRSPFMGFTTNDFQFQVEPDCSGRAGCVNFPVDQTLVDMFLNNTQEMTDANGNVVRTIAPFPIGNTSINRSQPFRLNPYGVQTGLSTAGPGGTWSYQYEKDLRFSGTVDWQANRYNRVKFGGDYTDIQTRSANYANSTNDLIFANVYLEKPKRASLFAQDRIDLGDLVIEAGLRMDRFDPNTSFPNIAGYVAQTLPDGTSNWHKVGSQTAFSPRLGVSFPVTVNSTFRLSYGHFVQTPDLTQYFSGKNTDYFGYRNTNTNDVFGRPLQMPRTISFEFGYRQLLGPDFVLDIAAYNKDSRGAIARRKLAWPDPTNPGVINYLNTTTNSDFGTTRGVDLKVDRRFSRVLSTTLAYSYVDARNTGSDPNTYTQLYARIEGNANVLLGLPPNPPNAMHITEEDRTHNLTGTFQLAIPADESSVPAPLRNVGLFGAFRFASGLPYTRVTNVGDNIVTGPPTNIGLAGTLADQEVETGRTPWSKNFDLRLTRGVNVGRINAQLFLDARNILDFTNKNRVFLTTGDIVDQAVFTSLTNGFETSVGGGTRHDLDLHTMTTAGKGVLTPVDLVALQRAEARFGNGDKIFTLDEQQSAFMADVLFDTRIQNLVGAGRRLRLGIDFTF
jgi:outer membrane receptor protein involved in Fe transport